MKMIGRHANARYTRAAAVAVTAFSSHSRSARYYYLHKITPAKIAALSINRRDRRSFETIA